MTTSNGHGRVVETIEGTVERANVRGVKLTASDDIHALIRSIAALPQGALGSTTPERERLLDQLWMLRHPADPAESGELPLDLAAAVLHRLEDLERRIATLERRLRL